MTAESIPFLIPYIVAFLISATVTVITWRRRKVIGARLYAGVALGQTSIILGYILELANTSLEGKIFWDDFQWMCLLLAFVGEEKSDLLAAGNRAGHCSHPAADQFPPRLDAAGCLAGDRQPFQFTAL